jgi:hypothetical protein
MNYSIQKRKFGRGNPAPTPDLTMGTKPLMGHLYQGQMTKDKGQITKIPSLEPPHPGQL